MPERLSLVGRRFFIMVIVSRNSVLHTISTPVRDRIFKNPTITIAKIVVQNQIKIVSF